MSKIEVKNVFKIFGTNPDSVLPMVKEGASKEEVLEKTGHTVGLDNVSLSIEEGETFVCMGLSGSGKSTLIRHLNRLIDPTDGDIIVDGTNVMELSDQQLIEFRKHEMSMVFQRFGLFPHKTVLENVGYGLEIQGKEVEERKKLAMAQIESVGLQGFEDQYPSQLSGGMQQRVGLARALATNPQILLMDEAFSALDPLIRSDMQSQLIELQAKLKKTIVFITHDLDESLRLGDHIGILNGGRLVQAGTPEEIIMNPADDYVEAFVKDVNRAKVLRAKTVMVKVNEFDSKNLKLADVFKVDEGSYIEQFLPKVLADRCTIQVVDKMGDIKGYITEKELSRLIRQVSRKLNLHKITAPNEYFDKFISDLQLPPNIFTQVNHLWSKIQPHEDIWQGKKPMGVAAALIYKAASESGTSRTQSDICKVANVSEVTLRGLLRIFDGLLAQLGEASKQ
jgi:glycine betaine/proline transport system ATP-binding protein